MAQETRTLTCIRCPRGCQITVSFAEGGAITSVSGNSCPRGDTYARKEVTHPTRVVTTTVPVVGQKAGEPQVVSVKTAGDVPKGQMMELIWALKEVQVEAPVAIGDVICPDICHTGVDIVATKSVS